MDFLLQLIGAGALGFGIGYGIACLVEWAEKREAQRRRGAK